MNRIVIRIIDGMIEQIQATEPTEVLVLDELADSVPFHQVVQIHGDEWIAAFAPVEVSPESVESDFKIVEA